MMWKWVRLKKCIIKSHEFSPAMIFFQSNCTKNTFAEHFSCTNQFLGHSELKCKIPTWALASNNMTSVVGFLSGAHAIKLTFKWGNPPRSSGENDSLHVRRFWVRAPSLAVTLYLSVTWGGDLAKFWGLLRIYELYIFWEKLVNELCFFFCKYDYFSKITIDNTWKKEKQN